MYVSFSESIWELRQVAKLHGWPLDEIIVCELASEISERAVSGSSIFHGAEVDLPEIIGKIIDGVERFEPARVAIDSLTALRYMAESHRHYRRSLFQLKVSLEGAGATTLFVGEKSERAKTEAESLVHGVFDLAMETPSYGPVQRRMEVSKLRGRSYETGFHDFTIVTGGLELFPRIRPRTMRRHVGETEAMGSGIESVDKLLGGGLERGTTTLLMGPSGTGKTSLVMHYALAAAERGETTLMYAFDEDINTIEKRAENMGIPLVECLERGLLQIRTVDAAEMSPGQFAHIVHTDVAENNVAFVAIDSLNGYMYAMPNERALVPHLHDLLTHLGRQGVVMMLVMTLSGLFDASPERVAHLSYLADTILFTQYYEHDGAIGKSIAAVKHRTREHEKAVRELVIEHGGIRVGEPLVSRGKFLRDSASLARILDKPFESERHDDRNRTDDD